MENGTKYLENGKEQMEKETIGKWNDKCGKAKIKMNSSNRQSSLSFHSPIVSFLTGLISVSTLVKENKW